LPYPDLLDATSQYSEGDEAMNAHANRASKRNLARLAPTIDKQLLAYATAATAAGIGLLAQPAAAKVVYTPASISIPLSDSGVHVDINNDGVSDFVFYHEFAQGHQYPEGAYQSGLLAYGSVAGNDVWGVQSKGVECAAVLPNGIKVGPGKPFAAEAALFSKAGSYTRGVSSHCKWHEANRGAFLGLKFIVNGQTHYGWMHVTAGANNLDTPVINGYAYETVPNKPILTGERNGPVVETQADLLAGPELQPASLGLLARGHRWVGDLAQVGRDCAI
jgi:hypothetical protein